MAMTHAMGGGIEVERHEDGTIRVHQYGQVDRLVIPSAIVKTFIESLMETENAQGVINVGIQRWKWIDY